MPSTRSNSSKAILSPIHNKTIARSTTCSDLFSNADLEFACERCKGRIDVLSCSRKKKVLNTKKSTLQINVSNPGMNPMPQQALDPSFMLKYVKS